MLVVRTILLVYITFIVDNPRVNGTCICLFAYKFNLIMTYSSFLIISVQKEDHLCLNIDFYQHIFNREIYNLDC